MNQAIQEVKNREMIFKHEQDIYNKAMEEHKDYYLTNDHDYLLEEKVFPTLETVILCIMNYETDSAEHRLDVALHVLTDLKEDLHRWLAHDRLKEAKEEFERNSK